MRMHAWLHASHAGRCLTQAATPQEACGLQYQYIFTGGMRQQPLIDNSTLISSCTPACTPTRSATDRPWQALRHEAAPPAALQHSSSAQQQHSSGTSCCHHRTPDTASSTPHSAGQRLRHCRLPRKHQRQAGPLWQPRHCPAAHCSQQALPHRPWHLQRQGNSKGRLAVL